MNDDVRRLWVGAVLVGENLMRNKVFANSQSIPTQITYWLIGGK